MAHPGYRPARQALERALDRQDGTMDYLHEVERQRHQFAATEAARGQLVGTLVALRHAERGYAGACEREAMALRGQGRQREAA